MGARGSDLFEVKELNNIDDLIPRTLDDIVRLRRDEVQIQLATAAEIETLGEFLGSARLVSKQKDTIEDWYPLAFAVRGERAIQLLGHFQQKNEILLSSAVAVLDLENSLVRTADSVYRLGKRVEGKPPRDYLAYLCAILNNMGLGWTLGVPRVFF